MAALSPVKTFCSAPSEAAAEVLVMAAPTARKSALQRSIKDVQNLLAKQQAKRDPLDDAPALERDLAKVCGRGQPVALLLYSLQHTGTCWKQRSFLTCWRC